MKTILSGILLGLVAWTIVAQLLKPDGASDSENTIVYATNSTPARSEQIAAFNRSNPDLNIIPDLQISVISGSLSCNAAAVSVPIYSKLSMTLISRPALKRVLFSSSIPIWIGSDWESTTPMHGRVCGNK